MARRANHAYEKRQRELAKQARRKEKLERKRAAREARDAGVADTGVEGEVEGVADESNTPPEASPEH